MSSSPPPLHIAEAVIEDDLPYPWWWDYKPPSDIHRRIQILSRIFLTITCIVGIIGNGLVIWIISFKIKTISTKWFLHLAITDFICSLSTPLRIAQWIPLNYYYNYNIMCRISSTVLILNMFTSVCFLTAISIDRCVSIMWPIWTKIHQKRLVTTVIIIIWIVSILISLANYFYDNLIEILNECSNVVRMSFSFTLSADYTFQFTKNPIRITSFVILFGLPFTIILLCNSLIFWKLSTRKGPKKYQRTLKIIIALVACFFCCWFPYNLWLLLELPVQEVYMTANMVIGSLSICLLYARSSIHPILYVFLGKSFTRTLRESIPALLKNAFSDPEEEDNNDTETVTCINSG